MKASELQSIYDELKEELNKVKLLVKEEKLFYPENRLKGYEDAISDLRIILNDRGYEIIK